MSDQDIVDGNDDVAVYRRPAAVVTAIMECGISPDDGINWTMVIGNVCALFPNKTRKTIENTVYDLIAFGAIRKTGAYERRQDTRILFMTPLGQAWWNQDILEPIGAVRHED